MSGILCSDGQQRWLARLAGALRVLFVVTLMSFAAIAALLSTAKAKIGESLAHWGEPLINLMEATPSSNESPLIVNGLELRRATGSTPLSIKLTLDRLQRFCSEHGGIEAPEALLTTLPSNANGRTSGVLDGTYRYEDGDVGIIACIDTGSALSLDVLRSRLAEFARTGNLSTVGTLRYVLARREKEVTSVLVLWTNGEAPLLKMFPSIGDAPGKDVAGVPRPNDSDRVFSAMQPGLTYGVTVYRSTANSSQAVSQWYEQQLTRRGWQLTLAKRPNTLIARQGSRTVLVSSVSSRNGKITTAIAELS